MPSPVFPGQSYIFFCYILIDKKLNCITIMYDTIKYLTFDIFFYSTFFYYLFDHLGNAAYPLVKS